MARVLAFMMAFTAALPTRAAPAQLALDVTLVTESGDPIPDAPVEASTPHADGFAMTGPDGHAHFVLSADDSDAHLVARLWTGQEHDLGRAPTLVTNVDITSTLSSELTSRGIDWIRIAP